MCFLHNFLHNCDVHHSLSLRENTLCSGIIPFAELKLFVAVDSLIGSYFNILQNVSSLNMFLWETHGSGHRDFGAGDCLALFCYIISGLNIMEKTLKYRGCLHGKWCRTFYIIRFSLQIWAPCLTWLSTAQVWDHSSEHCTHFSCAACTFMPYIKF